MERRLLAAEQFLEAEISSSFDESHLLGARRLKHFRERVWPGIRAFGSARPMVVAQPVNAPKTATHKPKNH
jgi:hypothetical protein